MRRVMFGGSARYLLVIGASFAAAVAPGSAFPADATEGEQGLQAYYSANGLLNRGLFDLAAEEYRKFLSGHSAHEKTSVAQYGLAVCLFRLGQLDEAAGELKKLEGQSAFAFAAEVETMLGQCHLARERFEPAANAFERVVRDHPRHDLADDAGAGGTEALYRMGKFAEAAERCRIFLDRWPQSPLRDRVRYFWGLSQMASGEPAKAAEQFNAMLSSDPQSPLADHASLLLAQCFQQSGRIDEAVRRFRTVGERSPDRFGAEALLGLGVGLRSLGRLDEAGVQLDRLLKDFANSPQAAAARFQRGLVHFDQGRYDQALESFNQVDPTDESLKDAAAYWTAKCQIRRGEFGPAAERLASAVRDFPQSKLQAAMVYDQAFALMQSGQVDGALAVLGGFAARFPEDPLAADASYLTALALHQLRRFDESRRQCEMHLDRYAKHASAASVAFLLAENDFLSDRWAEAAEGFRKFLAHSQSGPEKTHLAKLRLGFSLYRLGRFEQAAGPLKEVVETAKPGNEASSIALWALGDMAFQRGEWKPAEEYLRKYVSSGEVPSADDALMKLGLSLQRLSHPEEALAVFQRLIASFPQSPHRLHAIFERGQAGLALGRQDEATEAFRQVLAEDETSRFAGFALHHLGAAALRERNYAEAASFLEKARVRCADDPIKAHVLLNYGQALLGLQRYAEAQASFEQFIEVHPSHDRLGHARAQLSIALARQDKYEEALRAIERVERSSANDLDRGLWNALGYEKAWCLRKLGRPEAADAYRTLVGEDVDAGLRAHALLELAELEISAGRHEAAEPHLRRLREVALTHPGAITPDVQEQGLYHLAVCEFKRDRFGPAAELFEEFLQRFPMSAMLPSGLFFGAEALVKADRHEKAVAGFTRIVDEFPAESVCAPAMLRLGDVLAVLHRWARSETVFTDYLQRFADGEQWYQAQFGIGWARENQQRWDEAIAAYREVTARHQGETAARAQFQIGECLFAKQQYKEAAAEFLKVDILYAYPEWSGAALYEAGRCFEKLGQEAQARAQFEAVAQKYAQTRWATLAAQRLAEATPARKEGSATTR